MSHASVEQILGKAILDADFRDSLLCSPEQVLAGFNLTNYEKYYLKRMDAETLDQLANLLIERDMQWRGEISSNSFH
ncbi:MAG: hypothetical protein CL609_05520 [Anaerolineaceae bacterium]|nr:hypothetical protein [Anaerolineaceae bacterium]